MSRLAYIEVGAIDDVIYANEKAMSLYASWLKNGNKNRQ